MIRSKCCLVGLGLLLVTLGSAGCADDGPAKVASPAATSEPGPIQPATAAPAASEAFDETDVASFRQLARAIETSKSSSASIWAEAANGKAYEFHSMPIYWVRRADDGKNQRGYLFHHPSPKGERVQAPVLDELSVLGPAFRYDAELAKLGDENFLFTETVAGGDSFVFPYRKSSTEEYDPSLPSSPEFFYLLVHEAFHRYQMVEGGWIEDDEGVQDEAGYPLTQENVALALLEHRVLARGLAAKTAAEREEALMQFAAVRGARAKLPEVVVGGVNYIDKLDANQELIEGTANYAELRFRERAGDLTEAQATDDVVQRLEAPFDTSYLATVADVRMELAFGRFYATGSAIGRLLDAVGQVDWRSACAKATPLSASVKARFPALAGSVLDEKLAAAKSAHDYAGALVARADALLALPPGSLDEP
jgi:hypothetical protein